MIHDAIEVALDLGLLVFYAALSGVLTIAGILVEYSGVRTFLSGDPYLALYIAGLGAIVLYFAYLTATEKLAGAITRHRNESVSE